MPHNKSAEERLRQTEKRTAVNRSRLSRVIAKNAAARRVSRLNARIKAMA